VLSFHCLLASHHHRIWFSRYALSAFGCGFIHDRIVLEDRSNLFISIFQFALSGVEIEV